VENVSDRSGTLRASRNRAGPPPPANHLLTSA
jgi:hypothetical protein